VDSENCISELYTLKGSYFAGVMTIKEHIETHIFGHSFPKKQKNLLDTFLELTKNLQIHFWNLLDTFLELNLLDTFLELTLMGKPSTYKSPTYRANTSARSNSRLISRLHTVRIHLLEAYYLC
jgi:hypothetical protein